MNRVSMYDYYDINLMQKFFPKRLREVREARAKEYEREHKEPEDPGKRGPRPNRFTQYKLAKALKVNRQTFLWWEEGIGLPSLEKAVKLCILLDCDLDYLLGRCDTYHRETAEISEATGLSTAAADTLRKWKSILDRELAPSIADDVPLRLYGIKTLNSLLTYKEGLEILKNVGFYLHGRFKPIPPYEDRDREIDGSSFDEAKKTHEEERRRFNERYVTFEVENPNFLWAMEPDYIKSMFLSSTQESLVKLKTQIDADKKRLNELMEKDEDLKKGGSADGNGEEAR